MKLFQIRDDIAFLDYRKQDIHGTTLYPAAMIAPLQNVVLSSILENERIDSIVDPFCGSGTALYEAAQLDDKVRLVGCDINPLALLITDVKLEGVSRCVKKEISELKSRVDSLLGGKVEIFAFPNVDKWYRDDIKKSLSVLRVAIKETKNARARRYFWYHCAVLARRYANTRSSTFKLHIKTTTSIAGMKDNVVSDFFSAVENNLSFFIRKKRKAELNLGDVLLWLPKQSTDAFDMCITSPPYGENATTVTYGEFSWLPLNWIDKEDLNLSGWELENSHRIDTMSLGGSRACGWKKSHLTAEQMLLLDEYLSRISSDKQKKVINFFADYFNFLDELARVTKKYIVMTLGNRTVDRVRINLTSITEKYLVQKGYKIEQTLTRPIVNKRIPKKTSCVKGAAVDSMNDEFVIIAKKQSISSTQ